LQDKKNVRFLIGGFGAQNKSMNVNFGGVDLYLGFSVKPFKKAKYNMLCLQVRP
jgi:hypothetical protein